MAIKLSLNNNQNIKNFTPPVYYRDTFGSHPVSNRNATDSLISDYSDNESVTTKSTVKTTIKIFHPRQNNTMHESEFTDLTQSYQVDQILTNQVLISHAWLLLILTLVELGCAIQLFIFAVICIFFDGSPYYVCLIASIFFLINFLILFYFVRQKHSRNMLILCFILTSICFILSWFVFFWTVYLIYNEDKQLRRNKFDLPKDLQKINHIIRNTRIAMYSLHMILTPIHTVCCAAILYILFINKVSTVDGKISKGYFFSKPTNHQTVLVPITLKQVKRLDEPNVVKNTSIGVQT